VFDERVGGVKGRCGEEVVIGDLVPVRVMTVEVP